MQRKNNAVLIAAAAFGALIVAGSAGISYTDEPVHHPHDRANHHPKQESVAENQAVVTRLGNGATAVSYWASAADGWHLVTTVDTVVAADTETEQHLIVRFSATLQPGQEQLVSVPGAPGTEQQALRIRRVGDNIQMMRIADPSI
ncbi:MAG TPA: hypothetical protein VJ790_15895 [Dongiaceae bacterium]|nr:hypothetical protein [Dongiaceae bacterium]